MVRSKQVQMMLRVFEKCDIKDVKVSLYPLHSINSFTNCLQSFSKLKIESDPDTDYFYFYQPMDTLNSFGKATADLFCDKEDEACKARMNSFGDASTLDVKYDSVSRAAKLTIMWAPKEQSLDVAASKKRRVEVGILEQGVAANQESYESGLSGLLTVLGENKEPSPVLFNFPARHRKTADTFTASFPPPTGIHPTLQLSVSSSTSPNPDGKCSPHAYLTLPNVIFADRYQLADSLFLASKNLTGTPQISTPVDLEAPAYNTSTWGSNALVQLAPPKDTKGAFTSEIPLHLRYVAPKDSGGQAIELPYPVVFWACDPVADADLSKSPFDNAHLGYDDLFPQGTTFWHINPKPESGDHITSQLVVPALEEEAASTIAFGTAAVVILGFTWVLWKVIRGVVANGYGTKLAVEEKKEDKKKK